MEEKIKDLVAVAKVFESENISYSLGGSGLLYSLGLTHTVNDWDITTNEPLNKMAACIKKFTYQKMKSGDYPFASTYKLLIKEHNTKIEIIGDFSIYSSEGLCKIPTIASFNWQGIKIGSPEVWYIAYKLMNREEKANKLLSHLLNSGADGAIVKGLLNEPLPAEILITLESLQAR